MSLVEDILFAGARHLLWRHTHVNAWATPPVALEAARQVVRSYWQRELAPLGVELTIYNHDFDTVGMQ